MLVLNLREDEWLHIGEAKISLAPKPGKARNVTVVIDAPKTVGVYRQKRTPDGLVRRRE